jgi:ATP-dependent exoDNAse (exonuclease V) alpha subunit
LAIFHHSIKIISRGKGRSAVAAAAYRSGETLTNGYDGITHDYTRKGGIVHTEILLPENAPEGYKDRSVLWNAVEKIEKARNAQLAREIEIALPVELTMERNIELARAYVQENFVDAGMCADVCIHDKGDGNPHAHIMLTLRPIDERGQWAAKARKEYLLDENGERIILPSGNFKTRKISTVDWNEQSKAENWRAAWEQSANAALSAIGSAERIDHRSYQRQGIEQIPTVHLGVAASQMERKGIKTERGNRNRIIEVSNKELRQTKARLDKLRKWIADEAKHDTPTLANVLDGILQGGEPKTRYAKIRDLKAAADTLTFMQTHRISTIAELRSIVDEQYSRLADIRESSKPVERRMKTLETHIEKAELIIKHRKVYEQYTQQKPKHREAFYETHRAEITLYESASRYMKEHLNGRTRIPLKAWRAERIKFNNERTALSVRHQSLKDEIREVETIRRYAESVERTIAPPLKKREKQRADERS